VSLKNLAAVCLFVFYIVTQITIGLFQRRLRANSVALIFSLSSEQLGHKKNYRPIIKSFSSQVLNPCVEKSDLVLIEHTGKNIFKLKVKNYYIVKYIPIVLFNSFIPRKIRMHLLIQLIRNWKKCFSLNVDYLRIRKEFEKIVYKELKNQMKYSLVTTQSAYKGLPTAFDYLTSSSTYMIWYSVNHIPIFKKNTDVQAKSYKSIRNVKNHLVWNATQSKWLLENYKVKSTIVGPIILPSGIEEEIDGENNDKIFYFDITAAKNRSNDQFYNTNQCIRTLLDLINCQQSIQITKKSVINLKPKRDFKPAHSQVYIKFLKSLNKLDLINLIDSETSLEELVPHSKLVLGLPWTSPVVYAKQIHREAYYYVHDPKKEWALPNSFAGVRSITLKEIREIFKML
jgi:polysaccharide biosynthesis PFTS motif protein